jgi:hypothetical protein
MLCSTDFQRHHLGGEAHPHIKNVSGRRLLSSCSGLFLSSPPLAVVFLLPLPLSLTLCLCLCLRSAALLLLLHSALFFVFSILHVTR